MPRGDGPGEGGAQLARGVTGGAARLTDEQDTRVELLGRARSDGLVDGSGKAGGRHREMRMGIDEAGCDPSAVADGLGPVSFRERDPILDDEEIARHTLGQDRPSDMERAHVLHPKRARAPSRGAPHRRGAC